MAEPFIYIDPAVRFGAPNIRGYSCEALAACYAAGDDPCEDYAITRHELLLALWSEAQHGTYGRRRKEWKAWADDIAPALGGHRPLDLDAIEWPPVRPSRGICAVCGRDVPVRMDGKVKVHYPPPDDGPVATRARSCNGSGTAPALPEDWRDAAAGLPLDQDRIEE